MFTPLTSSCQGWLNPRNRGRKCGIGFGGRLCCHHLAQSLPRRPKCRHAHWPKQHVVAPVQSKQSRIANGNRRLPAGLCSRRPRLATTGWATTSDPAGTPANRAPGPRDRGLRRVARLGGGHRQYGGWSTATCADDRRRSQFLPAASRYSSSRPDSPRPQVEDRCQRRREGKGQGRIARPPR
jgi:hypothetical protein